MAALLAAVCSVPLTSVLLLFELTKDYHILLPLMVRPLCFSLFFFLLPMSCQFLFVVIDPNDSKDIVGQVIMVATVKFDFNSVSSRVSSRIVDLLNTAGCSRACNLGGSRWSKNERVS